MVVLLFSTLLLGAALRAVAVASPVEARSRNPNFSLSLEPFLLALATLARLVQTVLAVAATVFVDIHGMHI